MSEELDSTIKWYVMQVMSGKENKVFESLCFDCAQDVANVVEQVEENPLKFHSVYRGLHHGIFEVNMPYEHIEERKQGKKISKDRKLYPGYILLRARLTDVNGKFINENISYINNTKNVIGLIGGQTPVCLSEDEVAKMTKQNIEAKESQVKPKPRFSVGQRVVFKTGSFENTEGIVEAVDELRSRLKISVSVFGRATIVDSEFWQVERV